MPRRSGRVSETAAGASTGLEAAFNRIANLLALLLVKGESETEKVLALTGAGFSPGEIAALLGKQPNTVSVILYKAKQEARRKPKS